MSGSAQTSNLIFGGFMGTGKSTAGKLAAARLDLPFIDTDAAIEAEAGKPIAAIFAEDGEARFRMLEATLCRRLGLEAQAQVIAVGGGALRDKLSRRYLEQSGIIVCLRADLDTIIDRVGVDPSRPLFGDRDAVARLLAARKGHYDSFRYQIDTSGKTPDEVAQEAIALWQQVN